jgi:hypothetical protein
MNKKDIKRLLLILIIFAISLQIAGQISPQYIYATVENYDDLEIQKENRRFDVLIEYNFLYERFVNIDYTLCMVGEPPIRNEAYFILYVVPIMVVDEGYRTEWGIFSNHYLKPLQFNSFFSSLCMGITYMVGAFYIIFSYYSLIYINRKKTRLPLYVGIMGIVAMVSWAIIVNAIVMRAYWLGNWSSMFFWVGLGFYYMFISSIIYIAIYFLQNKFYITDKEGNVIGFNEKPVLTKKSD